MASSSAFSFLLSEYIQYSIDRTRNIEQTDLELSKLGYQVGLRIFEHLCSFRKQKLTNNIIDVLFFIKNIVWKEIYLKDADSVEKIDERNYLLVEKYSLISRYMDGSAFNVGLVKSILDSCHIRTNGITAHYRMKNRMKEFVIYIELE